MEVYGVFTRALREADRRRMGAYSVREKQDLQIDDPHCALRAQGHPCRQLNIAELMTEKAAR